MSQPFCNLNMKTKFAVSKSILYVSLLAFISFVVYILYINQIVLYTANERSEFIVGEQFFNTLISKPFGLTQYVGAWLTQFFYNPAVGSSVLLAIWVLIFFVGIKAFRLKGSAFALMLLPIACLLTSMVDLGYWIYIFRIKGYWFSHSVAYLAMLLLLWAACSTPRKYHIVWYVIGFTLYPVLGWLALLFILCLALSEKPTWREFVGLVLIFLAGYLWHILLYPYLKSDDVIMAGMPRFVTPLDISDYHTIPFWCLGAVSLFITLFRRFANKSFVPLLCVGVSVVFTSSLMFKDKNYINEMRMVRSAEIDNWKDVLELYSQTSSPTVTMVMLKNVALMNEGGLFDCSFKMGNNGTPINNPDSIHVSFLQIAAPVVYYNYGLINESFRLNFECAVQNGFSPFRLKMLARCAKANLEKKLVERYLTQLHGHPFYASWQPSSVTKKVQELQKCYADELTGIENSGSYIVNSISLWYESESKLASEQALFYSMIRCDPQRFWTSIRKYVKLHMEETFPLHAQEAYILYMDKAPEQKRIMLPVEQDVYERYKLFWDDLKEKAKPGVALKTMADGMRPKWGETYWFYYTFERKPYYMEKAKETNSTIN